MANITDARDAKEVAPDSELDDPVLADEVLLKGALYGLDEDGYAVNLESGAVAKARGIVVAKSDNTDGDDGDKRVRGKAGVFQFHRLSGSEPEVIGSTVYADDNQTVSNSSDNGARPIAGMLVGLSRDGKARVAVDIRITEMLEGNPGRLQVPFEKVSSKAADAEVARIVIGAPCRLVKFYTVLNDALATADATVQAKKNGSNIGSTTTGLATIAFTASAAGDVDSATPLTTNVDLDAGDILSFTVGGGSTATGTLNITAVLEPIPVD